MRKGHIDIISLGCSKNLVDSERLMDRLGKMGWTVAHDPETPNGEYVVVNTCGFIGDAKEESIEMILNLSLLKKSGKIGKIVVMGCLSERYRNELLELIPEIDLLYGKFDWNSFLENLKAIESKGGKEWERKLTGLHHSCYLKISEGCNRFCAFCAIPLITGRHTSRSIEDIEAEVKDLVAKGVKEFNVIAQDLSSYGLDLYGHHALPELLERLAVIPGVEWIRLHYAYPTDFPYGILPVMARHDNICKYLDIALQHISNPMLQAMRRHFTKEETIALVNRIRKEVPGIKLRTTLMVGFPGETDDDYAQLLEFVKDMRFERMGAFAYSEEEGTYGAINYEDNVPDEVKQKRLEKLMALQEEISLDLNEKMGGQRVKLLIDRIEGRYAVGRTQWDSPEVDQEVYVANTDAQPGDFIEVQVTEANEFDLYAEPV